MNYMECAYMNQKENIQPELVETIQYKYIVECKERVVHLEVDQRDVLHNADDEIDCPLDVVLRKNSFSLQDLTHWDARKIRFIQIKDEIETTLNCVSLDINL